MKILSTLKNVRRYTTFIHKECAIDISGHRVNYLKAGDGAHKLICLPGALGTIWSDFKPQIEGLDKSKFTVVVMDPIGYGKSRPPDRNFDAEFYRRDAVFSSKLMEALNIDKYSLLGWSDGGITGLILAASQPEKIEKLVVWGANAYISATDMKHYEGRTTCELTGKSSETVTDWFNMCREVCTAGEKWWGLKMSRGLLVKGNITEVDCCREIGLLSPKTMKMWKTSETTGAELMDHGCSGFTQRESEVGSVIHSDEWASYRCLNSLGFQYKTVNHQQNYVDPESGAQTQGIRDTSKWSEKMRTPLEMVYGAEGLRSMMIDWYNALELMYKAGGDICKNDLKKITAPVLILHGDKDPVVPGEHPEYLEKHLKNARLHRFPDGKHNIHLRYASEFNKIVTNFLIAQS